MWGEEGEREGEGGQGGVREGSRQGCRYRGEVAEHGWCKKGANRGQCRFEPDPHSSSGAIHCIIQSVCAP